MSWMLTDINGEERQCPVKSWPLIHGRDFSGQTFFGERCKSERCRGHRVTAWMIVDDESWIAVVGGEAGILRPAYFDSEAQRLGIRYKIVESGICPWFDQVQEVS